MPQFQPIGEIVEVTTTSFVAQCIDLERSQTPLMIEPPPFGSFVRVGPPADLPDAEQTASEPPTAEEADPFATTAIRMPPPVNLPPNQLFGLICHSCVTSLAAGRRPTALGLDETELLAKHPQLSELMKTEFSVMLIAFTDASGRSRCYLPPRPPRIHARVYACTQNDVRQLTRDMSFLRWIINPASPGLCEAPPEELVAACLRTAVAGRQDSDDFLLQAGRALLNLLGDDYQRLKAIFDRVM